VIVANADEIGGFALWVDEQGLLRHSYSMLGVERYAQVATTPLPEGDVVVRMLFEADATQPGTGGTVTLEIDGTAVGGGRIDRTVPIAFSSYAGMDIGRDNGLVVDAHYKAKAPHAFTGVVEKVIFDLAPTSHEDAKALHAHAGHAAVAGGIGA
jgi:arylsulfatase